MLAIYSAIKYFRHILEGRPFSIFTDHKPIIFAFSQKHEKATPRQFRYLEFIGQFYTDIRYLAGDKNQVADALSRINAITDFHLISYPELANSQVNDPELKKLLAQPDLSLKLSKININNVDIYCDTSLPNKLRPFVPATLRRQIFSQYHDLAHPGIRRTRNLISSRYIWPKMNSDIGHWVRSCIPCQRTKISKHTVSSIIPINNCVERFQHVHVDIIGPLPHSSGFQYCLTMMDRATRWPEVAPMPDMTAQTVVVTFLSIWVSRFGCPLVITTDQGRQFESEMLQHLHQYLGVKRIRTTAYHPQANGLIENFHHSLKSSLTAVLDSIHWTLHLPLILLFLRSCVIADTQYSPAEALYGEPLRLPGDFFTEKIPKQRYEILQTIADATSSIRSLTHHNTHHKTHIPNDLNSCSHVFLRTNAYRPPLTPSYSGPHKVLQRLDKFFRIEVRQKPVNISIDRLKPAYLFPLNSDPPAPADQKSNVDIPPENPSNLPPDSQPIVRTRYGRITKPVVRFSS